MIISFKCSNTEKLFKQMPVRQFATFQQTARRKLNMLHAAVKLSDLSIPPGNKLEQLVGDRQGQHSIRINDQWRLCFTWTGKDARDVEIVDYH